MVLKGSYGPDRVLYGLMGFLQNKLPSKINTYNSTEKASVLFTVPSGSITFDDTFEFKFLLDSTEKTIDFSAGTYNLNQINTTINNAETGLSSTKISDYCLIFSAASSIKILSNFGNLRANQVINYQALKNPSYYQISGVLPGEADLKCYPAVLINLDNIAVDPAGIVQDYAISLVIAITSPISSSQSDYLSRELFKYYDILYDLIYRSDDGSLGGICNGVRIGNAKVAEATGRSNYLKILTLSLKISVEED